MRWYTVFCQRLHDWDTCIMLSGGGSFPVLTLAWCYSFLGSLQRRVELLAVLAFGFVLFLSGYVTVFDVGFRGRPGDLFVVVCMRFVCGLMPGTSSMRPDGPHAEGFIAVVTGAMLSSDGGC